MVPRKKKTHDMEKFSASSTRSPLRCLASQDDDGGLDMIMSGRMDRVGEAIALMYS